MTETGLVSGAEVRPEIRVADPALAAVCAVSVAYAAALLRATRHVAALTPDATDYALVARSLARGGGYALDVMEVHPGLLPAVRHVPELHGLLQSFLIAPLFAVFGAHAALVKVPAVCFAAGLLVVTFVMGRRAFGVGAGFIAAGFVATRLDVALFAVTASDDVALAFFTALAFHAFDVALETRSRRWGAVAALAVGLATLAKFTGLLVLPPLVALASLHRGPLRRRIEYVATVLSAALAAGALYLARNHAVDGHLGFRFGALEILSKESYPAYFAYLPEPWSSSEAARALGPERFLAQVVAQVRLLGVVARGNPLVFVGGPLALAFAFRVPTARRLAVFGSLYTLAIAFVVCVPYHVEERYLLGLLPFYAAALAGAVVTVPARLRIPALAAAALAGVYALVPTVRFFAGNVPAANPACPASIDYLRRASPPDAAVLTPNPWFVAWDADRPAVNVPTNGDRAIRTVAAHYRTTWALTGAEAFPLSDLDTALRHGAIRRALRPTLVFEEPRNEAGGACRLYRLAPPKEMP